MRKHLLGVTVLTTLAPGRRKPPRRHWVAPGAHRRFSRNAPASCFPTISFLGHFSLERSARMGWGISMSSAARGPHGDRCLIRPHESVVVGWGLPGTLVGILPRPWVSGEGRSQQSGASVRARRRAGLGYLGVLSGSRPRGGQTLYAPQRVSRG